LRHPLRGEILEWDLAKAIEMGNEKLMSELTSKLVRLREERGRAKGRADRAKRTALKLAKQSASEQPPTRSAEYWEEEFDFDSP
jgi:16S rRNA U1498 N3-methylase RsmE